jgi:hypothetical protein
MTTLLHEIAHAAAWERNRPLRRRIMPHGAEWKGAFAEVLAPVLHRGLLPADIEAALARTMLRPAAATCSDRGLALALARYDRLEPGRIRAEELAVGTWFRVDDGTVFRAGPVLRTRRRCTEARTGAEYVVHGLAKVEPLDGAEAQALGRRRSRRAVSGPAVRTFCMIVCPSRSTPSATASTFCLSIEISIWLPCWENDRWMAPAATRPPPTRPRRISVRMMSLLPHTP